MFGPNGPSARDVAQGADGDCYFLAGLAELARRDPQLIRRAIHDDGNGNYTVTFHDGDRLVKVAVDDKLPVGANGKLIYANRLHSPALWPELMEKAFAKWKGGYPVINRGGYGGPAIAALTGWKVSAVTTNSQSPAELFARIQSTLRAGGAVLAGTPDPPRPGKIKGIVDDHMYSVLAAKKRPDGLWLRLRNPWGEHEPGHDGANDGAFWVRTAGLIKSFSGVSFGAP